MTVHFVLKMQPDPVRRFQQFLNGLYKTAGLGALLVPLRVNGETGIEPRIIEDARLLASADPFTPLMLLNSARLLLDYQHSHSQARVGAVMRPCELRAAATLHERDILDLDQVLAIGIDCLGTFDSEDLTWTGSPQPLAEEVLQFARQGGINPYRYRPACQMCIDPMPSNADITVDLLGLPARTEVLIGSNDETADLCQLSKLTDGPAPSELIAQHARIREQVLARRDRTRHRLSEVLNGELAMDVDSLTTHLIECETCQTCFEVCPIYEYIMPARTALTREEVVEWLMACSGCGMCEAACSDHLPLARIMNRVRATIVESLGENESVSM